MKKLLFFAMLAPALAAAQSQELINPGPWIGARPSVMVDVARGENPGTYVVSGRITDLRNGNVLATPRLETPANNEVRSEVGVTGMNHATTVGFTVKVAADGQTASFSSEVKEIGVALSAQHGTLAVTR